MFDEEQRNEVARRLVANWGKVEPDDPQQPCNVPTGPLWEAIEVAATCEDATEARMSLPDSFTALAGEEETPVDVPFSDMEKDRLVQILWDVQHEAAEAEDDESGR